MQTSWVDLLHWTLSCLLLSPESRVDCPCPWFHANSLPSSLSAVQMPTASSGSPSSTASQLLSPANSRSRPLTTPRYGEISGPRILCLVSRQNRQRNRLLWRATHIVLQLYLMMFPTLDALIVNTNQDIMVASQTITIRSLSAQNHNSAIGCKFIWI